MVITFVPFSGARPMEWRINTFTGFSSLTCEGKVVQRWFMILGGQKCYYADYSNHRIEIRIIQPMVLACFRKREVVIHCDKTFVGKWNMADA